MQAEQVNIPKKVRVKKTKTVVKDEEVKPAKVKKVKQEVEEVKTKKAKKEVETLIEETEEVIKTKKTKKSDTKPKAVKKTNKQQVINNDIIIIPTSRVKNYINNHKINKKIEDVLNTIKTAKKEEKDLDNLLTDEYKIIVSSYIEKRKADEEKSKKKKKDDTTNDVKGIKKVDELSMFDLSISAITKEKYKFSNDAFRVVAAISDMMVEEITIDTIKNTLAQKKSIINPEFSISNEYTNNKLYPLYCKSKTFQNQVNLNNIKSSGETNDAEEELEEEKPVAEDDETNINFEFHVRKIVCKVKQLYPEYEKVKIGSKFGKFCSDIIIDILDRIINILKIIVDINHNKTISKDIFLAVFDIMLTDYNHNTVDYSELFKTIDTIMKKYEENKQIKKKEKKDNKVLADAEKNDDDE